MYNIYIKSDRFDKDRLRIHEINSKSIIMYEYSPHIISRLNILFKGYKLNKTFSKKTYHNFCLPTTIDSNIQQIMAIISSDNTSKIYVDRYTDITYLGTKFKPQSKLKSFEFFNRLKFCPKDMFYECDFLLEPIDKSFRCAKIEFKLNKSNAIGSLVDEPIIVDLNKIPI